MSFKIATAYVSVEADDSGLRASITEKVKAAADGVVGNVKLDVDADGLAEKIKAEAEFANAEAHVKVKVDESSLAEEVRAEAAAVDAEAHVKVKADDTGFAEEVKAAAAAADTETHVKVKVDEGGLSDFEQEFRRAMAEGDQAMASADADMRRSFTSMESGSRTLRAAMADLEPQAQEAGRALEDAGSKASSAGNRASSSGGGFKAGAAGLAAMYTAGASLIPVLAAIPAVAAAAAAGVAVLGGAFGGVTKALHDYGAMDASVGGGGGGGGQTAATAYSDAVAVRNAQQAITDARTQAARSAQQDAEQVANAAQGVQDAERSAASATRQSADQIVAAKQQVANAAYAGVQAEQAYTNAVYNEQQADQALVNARLAAANQLVDSQNSARDAHLATEQAALNSDNAQRALTAGQGNSLLTTDQQAQLSLAAQQATQALADAKQHEKEATEAATAATTAGVDKAPTVLSAQHAAEQAAQAVANAQHGIQTAAQGATDAEANLAKAQQAAADQQVTSNEQVAKAEQGLTDAERQQAQDRADSAEQIAKAQQNLTDTIKEQQLQSAAGSAAGSAAANKYAQDLKNLSPAAVAFVQQVLSMKGELHDLALEAQTATLPGFTQMLKDSDHLLPVVQDGIKNIGGAFSNTAAAAGKLFANPDFDAAALHFEQIVSGGFAQVMSGLPPLMDAVVTSGAQAGPVVDALAGGIHNIEASGLPQFLTGLSTGMGGASQATSALFLAVDELLGPIGQLAGAAANAVGPAVADLLPTFTALVVSVEQDLLPLMPQLSTDLVDVAQVLDQLMAIATPVAAMIANDLAAGLRIIDPLLRDTSTFLQDNQRWLVPVAEGILGVVVAVKAWNLATSAVEGVAKLATTAMTKLGVTAKTTAEAETEASAAAGEAGFAGSLGRSLPVIGAVVIAGAALGTWLNHVSEGGQKAAASVDQYTTAMMGTQQAAQLMGGSVGAVGNVLQAVGDKSGATGDQMADLGIAMGKLSQMGFKGSDALKNYDGALANLVTSGHADRAKQIVDQITAATDSHGNALINTAKDFPGYFAALDKQAADQATATQKTQEGTTALGNMGDKLGSTADKFSYMTSAISQSQTLDQFHAQLLQLKDTLDQNGTSLDANSAKGLANRDAFSQIAQQVENYGQQLHSAGESDGLVASKMQDMVNQLEAQASKFGYSKQQVDAYIKSIGLIPSSVQTQVTAEIEVQINQQLLEAAAKQAGHVVGHYLVPGNAVGGLITGPGSGTSDSILRRLSNGEYVMTAQAVQQVGVPYLDALNYGDASAAGARPTPSPAPQIGGTTPQPNAPVINMNYYGTQQPTVEQQQNMMNALALAVRG